MAQWEAGTITVNDVDVPVKVDDVSGKWTADFAGQHLSTDTREQLKGKLDRLTRKTKVSVEVHVIRVRVGSGISDGRTTVIRGKLTGIHGGTGNVLAAWEVRGQVQREQITGWGQTDTVYVGGDTPDEALKEYAEIQQQLADLRGRREAWERRYKIKPKDAVEQAIRAAGGEA